MWVYFDIQTMRLITDFLGVEKCEEAFNVRPPVKFYYIQITWWLFLTKCELCLADLRGQVWLPGVPALHGCHQLLALLSLRRYNPPPRKKGACLLLTPRLSQRWL